MTATREPHRKRTEAQEEELVDVDPASRNWKGVAISLLVIVGVCSLIAMSVVVLTPAELASSSRSRLTVADLFTPAFAIHDPEATWISESEVTFRNRDGHVIRLDLASNESDVILSNSTFEEFKVGRFSLCSDLNYALFAYDVTQIYRHSFTASYVVYNIYTREVWELNPPEVSGAALQHAAWGPRGHQLIYIFENNIYYQADVRSSSLRITSSGRDGRVFNGLADWLYEEEVLGSHLAHWWSPDGEKLAFLTIDDSLVPNMVVPRFTGSSYPEAPPPQPYPLAGQTNPAVRLSVVHLSGATHTRELRPPDQLGLRDYYVTMVTWISDARLAVRWLNRPQNASVLTVCDAITGVCRQRLQETSDTWLSRQTEEPKFSADGSSFFLLAPVTQGGQGAFHHLAMITTQSERDDVCYLTSGHWEVTKIVAYDESDHLIYFLSTEDSAHHRHLYSVSTLGPFPRQCLTCGLKDECSFFDTDVSPDAQYAVLHCKGPGVPAVLLLSFRDLDSYVILEDNVPLRSELDTRTAARTEIQTVANDDFELPLKLLYPPTFSESFLYGLLLIVGAAPGHQGVTDEFRPDWDWVLVGSEQVIVARLDGRGSGFRGQRVLQQIHQRPGTVDAEDQIAALEYLVKLPFVDRTRVGVFGQDYGGFVTLAMLKCELISCAAVRSPVVDWSSYASASSERLLGSPSTDGDRYQASRVLPQLTGVRGGALFVAHATADANVHFHHSAELIKRLIQIGANYTLQIYPDEGHFLSTRSQKQLSLSLVAHFEGCLLDAASLLDRQRDAE